MATRAELAAFYLFSAICCPLISIGVSMANHHGVVDLSSERGIALRGRHVAGGAVRAAAATFVAVATFLIIALQHMDLN